jgi:hypothetical protein
VIEPLVGLWWKIWWLESTVIETTKTGMDELQLGNLANWAAAIGTVLAVSLALFQTGTERRARWRGTGARRPCTSPRGLWTSSRFHITLKSGYGGYWAWGR